MKIRKLHLKNIGVFDDEEINFQECPAKDKAEIHILTGENGTGKTTILQALASLFLLDTKESVTLNIRKNNFFKRFRNDFDDKVDFVVEDEGLTQKYYFRISKESENRYIQGVTKYPENILTRKLEHFLYAHVKEKKLYYDWEFSFSAFAYSGYRFIKNEKIDLSNKLSENPLEFALDFVKPENSKFTINQWLGRTLSKRALAFENLDKEANKWAEVIHDFQNAISDIIGYRIKFRLNMDLSLILIKNDQELDFDVLPDGLKSLISWIGDLLMRLDSLKWKDDTPIFDREIILFLDEIEVHLHPAWQRKVLPVVQKLFKNAQIFVSTHSPFVVNSVDDAWVYKLKVKDGKAKVESVERSEDARSYRYVLRNTFDIENEFGIEIENRLKDFFKERDTYLQGNGNSKKAKSELKKIAVELSKQSKELKSKIDFELFQLGEITGEDF